MKDNFIALLKNDKESRLRAVCGAIAFCRKENLADIIYSVSCDFAVDPEFFILDCINTLKVLELMPETMFEEISKTPLSALQKCPEEYFSVLKTITSEDFGRFKNVILDKILTFPLMASLLYKEYHDSLSMIEERLTFLTFIFYLADTTIIRRRS